MDKDVFTAGIERGGLTTEFEIRMLVCWLLSELKTPVTPTQLNFALQQEGLVNYFELTRAVALLLASGHLIESAPTDGERPMTVTALGEEAARTFARDLPLTAREKALSSAKESLLRERMARENRVDIVETDDGFRLDLAMFDIGSDLMSLSIYAPTRSLCEEMKRRFLGDPTLLYRAVVAILTGERLEDALPRDLQ